MVDNDSLTPEFFISLIKKMTDSERKKIREEKLLELILNTPEPSILSLSQDYEQKINLLMASMELINSQTTSSNTAEIQNLKNCNELLRSESLKQKYTTTQDKIKDHETHLNDIEQYLRVNNLEIAGVPEATENLSDEEILLEVFNSLPELPESITEKDIDICHIIPSNRKDKKNVAICKFVSRKTKLSLLDAKRKTQNFKYADNDNYFNEHLSLFNRHLFSLAFRKKQENHLKFLWPKHGKVFLRENENSEVLHIVSEESLSIL